MHFPVYLFVFKTLSLSELTLNGCTGKCTRLMLEYYESIS